MPNSPQPSIPPYPCRIYKPQQKNLLGIIFAVDPDKNRIKRIEIENKKISTISGIKIGDTREKVEATYVGQISEIPAHYGRKNLIYNPVDLEDKNYRLLFKIFIA